MDAQLPGDGPNGEGTKFSLLRPIPLDPLSRCGFPAWRCRRLANSAVAVQVAPRTAKNAARNGRPPNCTARSVEIRPLPRWRFALRPRFSISVLTNGAGRFNRVSRSMSGNRVFKVLCSDLAEGANRGAYLSCRLQWAIREPTDELQGVSV